MNDPENFLSRWSRRKRDANEQREEAAHQETSVRSAGNAESSPDEVALTPPPRPAAEFDVSSLPPIESIDSNTDISAFLQKGVPEALRHAALRRAWSSDPSIRDFVGLTENYWDGVGPEGVPGFGDLDPNLDVRRLVAELFGEAPRAQSCQTKSAEIGPTDALVPPGKDQETDKTSSTKPSPQIAEAPPSSTDQNVATQKQSDGPPETGKLVRRHVGAMPQEY